MGVSGRLYVTDANIWIDMDKGQIIDKALRLPLRLAAPDVIIHELKNPDGKLLVQAGLRVLELSGSEVYLTYELAQRYPAPSRADIFALALALSRKGILITGDKSLRKAAMKEEVPVRGTLWVLDEMIRHGIARPVECTEALDKMLKAGGRLPADECEKRLRKWAAAT